MQGEDFGEERRPVKRQPAPLHEECQTWVAWDNDLAVASQHRFGLHDGDDMDHVTRNFGIKLRIVWSLPFHTVNKSYLKTLKSSETSPKVQHPRSHSQPRHPAGFFITAVTTPPSRLLAHSPETFWKTWGEHTDQKRCRPAGCGVRTYAETGLHCCYHSCVPSDEWHWEITSEGSHVPDQTVTTERIACMLQLAS